MPQIIPANIKDSGTINPVIHNPSKSQNLMRRNLMIGGGIILLVGLGLMIKKYPKATIGSAAILFVLAYFFLGIMGPSRYQQWKNRNQQPKMIK
jgi:hypothetical protein